MPIYRLSIIFFDIIAHPYTHPTPPHPHSLWRYLNSKGFGGLAWPRFRVLLSCNYCLKCLFSSWKVMSSFQSLNLPWIMWSFLRKKSVHEEGKMMNVLPVLSVSICFYLCLLVLSVSICFIWLYLFLSVYIGFYLFLSVFISFSVSICFYMFPSVLSALSVSTCFYLFYLFLLVLSVFICYYLFFLYRLVWKKLLAPLNLLLK